MIKVLLMSALPVLAGGLWAIDRAIESRSTERIAVARSTLPLVHQEGGVHDLKGEEFSIVAELIPDAVLMEGPSEWIEYHAEISSNLSVDATYAYTARVVDELGNVVGEVAKGDGALSADSTVGTPAFTAKVGDGFYILSLRVAVVARDIEDSYEAVQFLRVRDQKMREMTPGDWYQASQGTLVSLTPAGDVK